MMAYSVCITYILYTCNNQYHNVDENRIMWLSDVMMPECWPKCTPVVDKKTRNKICVC